MPVHTYTNWIKRQSDTEKQLKPYRKYFFICEGANTETFYFQKLIDLRKELGIHPLIDICLWQKTGKDKDLSYANDLVEFAMNQKNEKNGFDKEVDKVVVVFDADVFEEKVQGYDKLIEQIEESDNAAVTNPGFELFLLLHIKDSYENEIKGHEAEFLQKDQKGSYKHAYTVLRDLTGMNAKRNSNIGDLANNVLYAISQEKHINQNIHNCKGKVTSNVGKVIEDIMNDKPKI